MNARIARPLALAAALIGLLACRPAQAQFGTNIIRNGNAEAGPGSTDGSVVFVFPQWTLNGTMTVIQYANNGNFLGTQNAGPANRGLNYFAGGPNSASATASQIINVSAGATRIDLGNVPFKFSASLGGQGAFNGDASVTADFLDVNSNVLATTTIGPVTAADRNNITELLRTAAVGVVPVGTRIISITMAFTRNSGTYDYGYADNLSLVLGNTGGFDVNGDGNNDLLFQNASTGQLAVWFMNNGQVTSGATLSQTPDPGWKVVGTGDFNGDGHPDILFQNQLSGQLAMWLMNGLNVIGGGPLPQIPETNWKASAVGDFNGDGQLDIAFQNTVSGAIVFWYLDGVNYIGGDNLSNVPNSGYTLVGAGDINGDGNTDLVFQNSSTNDIAFWFMSLINVTGGGHASMVPQAGWSVGAVGDIAGDGNVDFVFQNPTTMKVAIWYMSGLNVEGGGAFSAQPSPNYFLAGPR